MDSNPQNTRKVTIKDVIDEWDLEYIGITEKTYGTPINSSLTRSEFLRDSGIYKSPEYFEIQDRYRDKIHEKDEWKKYWFEVSQFLSRYFGEKVDEYLEGLNKRGRE